jgi:hypothetical protein
MESLVLPCRRPNLTPHPVHDVPGGTKKHGVQGLVVIVARLIVVVAHVIINDGGVVMSLSTTSLTLPIAGLSLLSYMAAAEGAADAEALIFV